MWPRLGKLSACPYRGGLCGHPKEACLAALTVFDINIAIVIGPTPAGTGVMAAVFGATSSNATSPTRR